LDRLRLPPDIGEESEAFQPAADNTMPEHDNAPEPDDMTDRDATPQPNPTAEPVVFEIFTDYI